MHVTDMDYWPTTQPPLIYPICASSDRVRHQILDQGSSSTSICPAESSCVTSQSTALRSAASAQSSSRVGRTVPPDSASSLRAVTVLPDTTTSESPTLMCTTTLKAV